MSTTPQPIESVTFYAEVEHPDGFSDDITRYCQFVATDGPGLVLRIDESVVLEEGDVIRYGFTMSGVASY